jgi:hypothetical protein
VLWAFELTDRETLELYLVIIFEPEEVFLTFKSPPDNSWRLLLIHLRVNIKRGYNKSRSRPQSRLVLSRILFAMVSLFLSLILPESEDP